MANSDKNSPNVSIFGLLAPNIGALSWNSYHSEPKRVHRRRIQPARRRARQLLPVLAVQIGRLDLVQAGVGPVDHLCRVVHGETVGPLQRGADQGLAVGAVKVGALDLRVVAPVAPEEIAVK